MGPEKKSESGVGLGILLVVLLAIPPIGLYLYKTRELSPRADSDRAAPVVQAQPIAAELPVVADMPSSPQPRSPSAVPDVQTGHTTPPHSAAPTSTVPGSDTVPAKTSGSGPEGAISTATSLVIAAALGNIEGEVLLTGPAPQAQTLNRRADPVCSKHEAIDETVLAKNGKLQNAVVRISQNAPAGIAVPSTPVIVNQQDCLYHPRVQAARAGQKLAVRNGDGTLHNIHAYEGSKTLFNQAQPPKANEIQKDLKGAEVIKLKCDVHPWMTGYIVVSDNPFFSTTGADGHFSIAAPAGTYTLESWHERFGKKTQQVTVVAGQPAKVTFTYAPDDRG